MMLKAGLRKGTTALQLLRSGNWSEFKRGMWRNFDLANDRDITEQFWDQRQPVPGTQWQDTPGIGARWSRMITGDPNKGYMEYVAEKYFTMRRPRQVLSLCCGNGRWEQSWARYYEFERIVGYDLSPVSIQKAQSSASSSELKAAFEYSIVDVENLDLNNQVFDVVLMNAGLHHLRNLEHVLNEIAGHLSGDGLFILNEFIGPSHFQWSDRQIEVINGLLAVLPHQYRTSLSVTGKLKQPISRPSLDFMRQTEPSEAARSSDIPTVVPQYFDILEWKPWGGAVLHLLLYEIAGNFHADSAASMKFLDLCYQAEDLLMELDELPSDFVFAICGKKQ